LKGPIVLKRKRHLSLVVLLSAIIVQTANCMYSLNNEFIKACKLNDSNEAKSLLEKGASPKSACIETMNSALHIACQNGNLDMVKLICEKTKIKPEYINDTPNNKNDTALHLACKSKNLKLVKYLIEEKNALLDDDGEECYIRGKNALIIHECACIQGDLRMLKYLCKTPLGKEVAVRKPLLHYACKSKNFALVKWVFNFKIKNRRSKKEINREFVRVYKPLHYACMYSNPEIVQYLIEECEADINEKIHGKTETPLSLAEKHKKSDIEVYLKSKLKEKK